MLFDDDALSIQMQQVIQPLLARYRAGRMSWLDLLNITEALIIQIHGIKSIAREHGGTEVNGELKNVDALPTNNRAGTVHPGQPKPKAKLIDPALEKWYATARGFDGRQKSNARAIEILRLLKERSGTVSLKEIYRRMCALEIQPERVKRGDAAKQAPAGKGKDEGKAALTTQLSRLKDENVRAVNSTSQAQYSLGELGEAYLKTAMANHPTLVVPPDVRKLIEDQY